MGTLTHYSYSLRKTVYPQINAIFYAVAKLDKILESYKSLKTKHIHCSKLHQKRRCANLYAFQKNKSMPVYPYKIQTSL
jgi:hypothetical protein